MKTAKNVLRFIGWFSFISGLVLLIACKILEYYKGLLISVRDWFNLDSAFLIGAVVGLCGLLIAKCVEDEACWESICRWVEKGK